MSVGDVMIYLFEVSIFMILLYIFNKFLIGNQTLHSFNRFVWLATIVLSFALPLAIWDSMGSVAATTSSEGVGVDLLTQAITYNGESSATLLEFIVTLLFALYLVGGAVLIIHNVILHISLIRIIHRTPRLGEDSSSEMLALFRGYERVVGIGPRFKVHYIIYDTDLSPFSWFNHVVVSRKDIEGSSARQILLHELSHVKQRHSLDIIFVTTAAIILWFNPAVWLLRRAMQQVHEYCADESVLDKGVNAKEYQLLLIKKSVGSRLYSISNTLNHSNLKNRITMMLKKKTSKMAAAKCLLSIPVLFFALFLLSSPLIAAVRDDVSSVKITKINETEATNVEESDDEAPFLSVETMPKFQGGDLPAFRNWVMQSIRYPAEAAQKNISGRVVASFIIEKNGSIKHIEILHSPEQSFSDEVVRLLKSSPQWTPAQQRGKTVRLKYTMPIEFALRPNEASQEATK
ncbi:MAG: M56 family metallopeptidase [Rikenellaceae bacterium]